MSGYLPPSPLTSPPPKQSLQSPLRPGSRTLTPRRNDRHPQTPPTGSPHSPDAEERGEGKEWAGPAFVYSAKSPDAPAAASELPRSFTLKILAFFFGGKRQTEEGDCAGGAECAARGPRESSGRGRSHGRSLGVYGMGHNASSETVIHKQPGEFQTAACCG